MVREDTFVTTSFRTIGYAGAGLFSLAPPAFIYEMYLIFYTTAVEENPSIGLFAALTLVLSFASIPMMIVGRRQRHSASATLDRAPGAL
ncbi:hypothetical protein ASG43_17885 [Aureimonas sp. Leaf454]|uniref:hypothetical protein n=1 Tax=Aureimonas sp. Leaf454 TaxID=1736381 RepID=UPI0006F6F20F|nr:hypothetical protein [Aureimonas sp. Leaf454]KQT53704.1 hypothetical protein ASG43_17885 [Aureimonas sp. Leaf454]